MTVKRALTLCGHEDGIMVEVLTPTVTAKKKLRDTLVNFLLKHFPIIEYHKPRNANTYLVDGINPPDIVFNDLFKYKPCSVQSLPNTTESITQLRLQYEILLTKECDRLEKMKSDEWATERNRDDFSFEDAVLNLVVKKESVSSLLKIHPNLLELITEILKNHGEQYAQSRRRDDKAHTCGVSVFTISRFLLRDYGIDVSPCTIWRYFRTTRKNDVRELRCGGRYGYIETAKVSVKNSQLHNPHIRGDYLASQVRWVKELITFLQSQGINSGFACVDDATKFHCVVDATVHHLMHAIHRGHTLLGDEHNNLDHNFTVAFKGETLKFQTGGVAMCYLGPDDKIGETNDEYGRKCYPRACLKEMYASNRSCMKLKENNGDPAKAHWDDIDFAFQQTYGELAEKDKPSVFCVISDNGSGYNPSSEVNAYWADQFMQKHKCLKALCLLSFAAGESARNFEIEHIWCLFKKALISQNLGKNVLGSVRPPIDQAECDEVMAASFEQSKQLWEDNCNIAEDKDSLYAPHVKHVPHHTPLQREENAKIHDFFMKTTRKKVENNKELRDYARNLTDRSYGSFNQVWIFSSASCKDDEFKRKLFGASMKPLYPEEDEDVTAKRKGSGVIYKTFHQLQTKYKETPQPPISYDSNSKIPYSPKDTHWVECCDHLYTSKAALERHHLIYHGHGSDASAASRVLKKRNTRREPGQLRKKEKQRIIGGKHCNFGGKHSNIGGKYRNPKPY